MERKEIVFAGIPVRTSRKRDPFTSPSTTTASPPVTFGNLAVPDHSYLSQRSPRINRLDTTLETQPQSLIDTTVASIGLGHTSHTNRTEIVSSQSKQKNLALTSEFKSPYDQIGNTSVAGIETRMISPQKSPKRLSPSTELLNDTLPFTSPKKTVQSPKPHESLPSPRFGEHAGPKQSLNSSALPGEYRSPKLNSTSPKVSSLSTKDKKIGSPKISVGATKSSSPRETAKSPKFPEKSSHPLFSIAPISKSPKLSQYSPKMPKTQPFGVENELIDNLLMGSPTPTLLGVHTTSQTAFVPENYAVIQEEIQPDPYGQEQVMHNPEYYQSAQYNDQYQDGNAYYHDGPINGNYGEFNAGEVDQAFNENQDQSYAQFENQGYNNYQDGQLDQSFGVYEQYDQQQVDGQFVPYEPYSSDQYDQYAETNGYLETQQEYATKSYFPDEISENQLHSNLQGADMNSTSDREYLAVESIYCSNIGKKSVHFDETVALVHPPNDEKKVHFNLEETKIIADEPEIMKEKPKPGKFCMECDIITSMDDNFCSKCGARLKLYFPIECDPLVRFRSPRIATFGIGGQLFVSTPGRVKVNQFGEKTFTGSLQQTSVQACLSEEAWVETEGTCLLGPLNEPNAPNVFPIIDEIGARFADNELVLEMLPYFQDIVNFHQQENENLPNYLSAKLVGILKAPSAAHLGEYGKIQDYLISGQQDQAYQIAISIGAWPTALILASLQSQDLYAKSVALMLQNSDMDPPDRGFVSKHPALAVFLGICSRVDPESIVNGLSAKVDSSGYPEFLCEWRTVLSVIASNHHEGDVAFLNYFSHVLFQNDMVIASTFSGLLAAAISQKMDARNLLGVNPVKHPYTYFRSPMAVRLTEIYIFTSMIGKGWDASYLDFIPHLLWFAGYLLDIGSVNQSIAFLDHIVRTLEKLRGPSPSIPPELIDIVDQLTDRVFTTYARNTHESVSGRLRRIRGIASSTSGSSERGPREDESLNASPPTLVDNSIAFDGEVEKSHFNQTANEQDYGYGYQETNDEFSLKQADSQQYEYGYHDGQQYGYESAEYNYGQNTDQYNQSIEYNTQHTPNEYGNTEYNQYTNDENYQYGLASNEEQNNNYELQNSHEQQYQYGHDVQDQVAEYADSKNESIRSPTLSHLAPPPISSPPPMNSVPSRTSSPEPKPAPPPISLAPPVVNKIVPPPLSPVASQPPKPPVPKLEEEEDLGFGNKPKVTAPPSLNQPENKQETEPVKPQPEVKKVGFLSSIGAFFFGKKSEDQPAPVKAHLPSGTSFYYDEKLKKWVNKNSSGTAQEAEKPAPPPIMKTAFNNTSVPSNPTAGPKATEAPSGIPVGPPMPTVSSGKRKTARSRYVDIMNPNGAPASAPVPSFMPTFPTSGTVTQMMPMPVNNISEQTTHPQELSRPKSPSRGSLSSERSKEGSIPGDI